MAPTAPAAIKINLDLPADMYRDLRAQLADIPRGQGVAPRDGIRLSEDARPASADGARENGWSPLIATDSGDPLRPAPAMALIIPALLQFLGDREHPPRLREVHVVAEVSSPDGSLQRVLMPTPVLFEPDPEHGVDFEGLFRRGQDLALRIKFEIEH